MTTAIRILKVAGANPDDFQIGETVNGDKVVIGDWWSLDKDRNQSWPIYGKVEDLLHKLDYECYFDDDYILCDDCYKYVATYPGYYGDMELPTIDDNEVTCPDCTRNNPESYIDSLVNDPDRANHLLSDEQLQEAGFKLVQSGFEIGLHSGQNDQPVIIFGQFNKQFDELLFSIDRTGQFDTHFSLWGRNKQEE